MGRELRPRWGERLRSRTSTLPTLQKVTTQPPKSNPKACGLRSGSLTLLAAKNKSNAEDKKTKSPKTGSRNLRSKNRSPPPKQALKSNSKSHRTPTKSNRKVSPRLSTPPPTPRPTGKSKTNLTSPPSTPTRTSQTASSSSPSSPASLYSPSTPTTSFGTKSPLSPPTSPVSTSHILPDEPEGERKTYPIPKKWQMKKLSEKYPGYTYKELRAAVSLSRLRGHKRVLVGDVRYVRKVHELSPYRNTWYRFAAKGLLSFGRL